MDFNFDTGTIFGGIQTIDPTILPPLGGQAEVLTIIGTGAVTLSNGTTAQRPASPAAAMLRFNDDTDNLEFYDGTVWQTLSFAAGAVSSFKLDDLSGAPIFLTSPTVSTSGAISATITLDVQAANTVFAGPTTGVAVQPTFRSLVTADIPAVSNISGGVIGDVLYQSAPSITSFLSPSTANFVLTTNGAGNAPTWTAVVNSFSAGTTGFTPASPTTGPITLGGILNVANGGTGVITIPTNSVMYGQGTSPVLTTTGAQYEVLRAGPGGVPAFGAVDLAQTGVSVTGVLGLTNGGTNTATTGSNGSIMYNDGTAIVNSSVGVLNQALLSSGAGAPTWQTVSSTITTNEILQGDGAGAFTAEGASYTGTLTYSGVTLLGTVTNPTDATTKQYVDAVASGLDVKAAVRAATDVALTGVWTYANGAAGVGATLTEPAATGALTVDGIVLVDGDRVLIKDQVAQLENGIYIASGIDGIGPVVLTRSTGADSPAELNGAFVFVQEGTLNSSTGWTQTNNVITVGTTAVIWTQFSGAGTYLAGNGLLLTGNTFDVDPDGVTVYIDGGDQVAVLSSATIGQVLRSAGTGNTATWGAIDLTNSNAVSGVLNTVNGGTGINTSSATNGQLLIGNGTGLSLSTLTAGTAISITNGVGAITINNDGVTSFDAGSTGLTPAGVTTGAITLGGTLVVSNGGTGLSTITANGVVYGSGTAAVGVTAVGTTGQVLTGNTGSPPTWSALSGVSVTSFQTSLSGLTPSTPTTGVVTLAGTLGIASGGTGQITATLAFDALSPTTTTGDIIYHNGTTNVRLPVGTVGQILTVVTGEPTWAPAPASGVTTFSAGTTGFTPIAPTSGAVVLGGILDADNGGTGLDTSSAAPGALLIGTGSGLSLATLTQGSGMTITNGAGSITVANAGVIGFSLNTVTGPDAAILTTTPTGNTTGTVNSTITFATQAANLVFAGPVTGGAVQPTFRGLVIDDLSGALQLYYESATAPTTPVATGTNSVAIGSGSAATATGAFGNGDGTDARIFGQKAYANGSFATAGDAQHGVYIARNITTDSTLTELFLDGTATQLVLADNSVFVFDILVAGRRTDATGGGAGYRFVGVARKDATAGSVTFVGTPSKTVIGETDVPWDAAVSVDTGTGAFRVRVSGQNTKTIRWVATIQTTEVTN